MRVCLTTSRRSQRVPSRDGVRLAIEYSRVSSMLALGQSGIDAPKVVLRPERRHYGLDSFMPME